MLRRLLLVGGVLNALFFLFHIQLAFSIRQLPLTPNLLALMQALNVGGILFIFLFAFASLFLRDEMLSTRLGATILALAAALYLLRAAEEFVLFPRASTAIVAACTATGALYLALVLASLTARPEQPRRQETV